ncbi:MAG: 2TM domain-containing protein [Sulfuritalea sp.]|nr:2TM domain-containing protein [Sulfuritalea sp.]
MSRHSRFIDETTLSAAERDARRQVRRLRGFYSHLLVFAVINAGLAVINLIASPDRLWFYWPLLGWGVWLALHAFGTFARYRWLGAEWEERKMQQLLAGKSLK